MPKRTKSRYVNRPRNSRRWENSIPLDQLLELSVSEGKRLGRLFCDLRIMRGVKQEVLAEWSGVDKSVISNFETGNRLPQFRLVIRLFSALGANLSITLYKPNEHEQPKRQPRNLGRLESRVNGEQK